MKKISFVLAIFLAFGLISPALAQDGDVKSGIRSELEQKRLDLLKRIELNKDKVRENREKIEGKLVGPNASTSTSTNWGVKEERKELKGSVDDWGKWNRVKVQAGVAVRIFEATVSRLDAIVVRTDSRIAKLHQAGASTTEAVAFVNAAKDNLDSAKDHIAEIKEINMSLASSTASTTATTTASSTIMEAFAKIKVEAKEAREQLVEAKQNLMQALNVIKKLENGLRKNATTTLDTDEDESDDDDN